MGASKVYYWRCASGELAIGAGTWFQNVLICAANGRQTCLQEIQQNNPGHFTSPDLSGDSTTMTPTNALKRQSHLVQSPLGDDVPWNYALKQKR